ncbi:RAD50 protein [Coccidioides immitis H538.4]|uniref:RAD50 protein n=1 Tax=Coccidioides immitis H538.4 TaxID=396776 RepID=A0A0J8RHQ9_COCIT|nr:RAD50 protein [Coccidioides immitis H538.4]
MDQERLYVGLIGTIQLSNASNMQQRENFHLIAKAALLFMTRRSFGPSETGIQVYVRRTDGSHPQFTAHGEENDEATENARRAVADDERGRADFYILSSCRVRPDYAPISRRF